ncbi:MAG TPA: hypothetical protein VHY91_13985 [Pirellulales bacterium]|jgi:hypothetical protein|nr:hypothetical protein [Pirellulales bacterium]
MKKIGLLILSAVAAVTVADSSNVTPVHAFQPFKKEFENLYIKETPATEAARSLKAAFVTKSCGVCHPDSKDKKNRNNYGKAIKKFIPADLDKAGLEALKKNAPQIKELLEKAAKEPSDPKNPNSPTFGQRIEEGKLPGE